MQHQDPETTPQPSRRVLKTRRRILEAAAGEFAEKGYGGATTRGIASAAGVSELTLFRHFGTKKNLFLEAVQQGSALPGIAQALAGRVTGDLRQDLARIGSHFLHTLTERREAILMTLYEANRLPEVREISAQLPQQQRQMLASYLQRQAGEGKLRDLDPSMMAQAFLGMLFAYAVYQSLLDEPQRDEHSIAAVVEAFTDIFLEGVANPE